MGKSLHPDESIGTIGQGRFFGFFAEQQDQVKIDGVMDNNSDGFVLCTARLGARCCS